MIEPLQSGAALLDDIEAARAASGEVVLWWLGQSGYVIKTASTLFVIDPYLSEHLTHKYAQTDKPHIRMTRAPLRGGDLTGIEWVFASHKHSDHLDPGTLPALFEASPAARLILPAALIDHAVGLGLKRERLLPTRGEETLQVGKLTVHSIPSAHPGLDYDDRTGYPFLGFVFEADGVTIYHSGDTIVYDGLVERLQRFNIDLAFLPINGSDARREQLHVPPNMDGEQALALARQIGARLVIPHHYDMFTFNTADVGVFANQAASAGQAISVLHCGEQFRWSA